jgi:hypothetical protein
MSTDAFRQVIAASPRDRLGAFLTAANRLGTPVGNIEKDFWICWTLDALYHRLPSDSPRLLFKGGTSLSKGYNLIQRFSEDIDITVFRNDLGQNISVEELQKLSAKQRHRSLDAIRESCRNYILGPMQQHMEALLKEDTKGAGRVEPNPNDPTGQSLLIWYPEVEPRDDAYVQPAVRIESGAKSALDPAELISITPYVAVDIPDLDLTVSQVTSIEAKRTFWDKVIILHGLRSWFERRAVLRQEGQRISRHYYDLHCLMASIGNGAASDIGLGADCIDHARLFFDRPDFNLATAKPGTFGIMPVEPMIEPLRRDYTNTRSMIFGEPPGFDEILASIAALEAALNQKRPKKDVP